jgi:hypothetical protein
MDYQPVVNEENDNFDGQDQPLSPFMQFETQDEGNINEKRMEMKRMSCFS